MSLHWIDITIVAISFISVVYSAYKGMVRELFSLGSLFFGYLLANRYYLLLLPYLENIVGDGGLAGFLSFALSFLILYIAFHLLGSLIQKNLIDGSGTLSSVNRLIGAVIGLVKAMIILSLLYIPLHSFSVTDNYIEENSQYVEYLRKTTAITSGFMSDNPLVKDYSFIEQVERSAKSGFDDLKETISDGVEKGVKENITDTYLKGSKTHQNSRKKEAQQKEEITDKHTAKEMKAMDSFLNTLTNPTPPPQK